MDKPHAVTAVWTTSYIPLIAMALVAVAVVGGLLFWRHRRKPPPETKPTPSKSTESPGTAAGTIKCGKCGAENASNQKYCTDCGQSLTQ